MENRSGSTPGAVFSTVANETRYEILEALWNADEEGLAFSELYDAVGIRDSGQFNYHLGKLVDVFIRKEDEEYRLRFAGKQLIGAVLSGMYTQELTIEDIPIDETCAVCGGGLTGTYADEVLSIVCADCGMTISEYHVPPGVLDPHDNENLPRVLDQWLKLSLSRMSTGFCSLCFGPVEMSLSELESAFADHPGVEFDCARCGYSIKTIIGSVVLTHPAVVSFHYAHGINLQTTPLWGIEWLFEDHAEYVKTEEAVARITIDLDDDSLHVLVDSALDVVSIDDDDRGTVA